MAKNNDDTNAEAVLAEFSFSPFLLNLLLTAVAVIITMTITGFVGTMINNHSIVDVVWGVGFVVVASVSYLASFGDGDPTRRLVVFALVWVWGVRLAAHIGWRNRGHVDPRYQALMRHRDGPLIPFLIRKIYGFQGLAMWVISLPIQVAMYETAQLGILGYIGIALWAIGFTFEAVGDYQLSRFKADPTNKGKVLDTGLWGWTRHPNYFGDSVVWFGLWFLALGHWVGLLTIVGPLAITYLLVKSSGKALTERRMARSRGPEYQAYLDRVSGFLPRPPKRVS